ncbi:MAG: hypothetical protein IKM61_08660 [Eubacteriaceae bacterium]|nr:hypothetical protein [Eubacteriaceae bacterium]
MNDSPLPGSKRAVLIFISILILISFSLLSLSDWEDEEYFLCKKDEVCFSVRNISSGVLKYFLQKRVHFRISMILFACSSSTMLIPEGACDFYSKRLNLFKCSGISRIFILRC